MHTDPQPYRSRVGDPASRRFGTFSYLPAFDDAGTRAQVQHIVDRGWNCAIEHVEPARASSHYWYLWKLPLFGERDADAVLAELDACRAANPGDHVRLVGHDHTRQTLGMSFVVHHGRDA